MFNALAPRPIQSIGHDICVCVCAIGWDPEPCGLESRDF